MHGLGAMDGRPFACPSCHFSSPPLCFLLCDGLPAGIAEPLPVAETFTFDAEDGNQLMQHAKLDTTVTVVDGYNFYRDYTNGETLADRHMDAYKGDERAVVDLLVDQIEFADGMQWHVWARACHLLGL
jgi:hypothetical protein